MKQISTKMITSAINKVAILFIATIVFFSHASHAQVTPAQSQFLFAEDFNYAAATLLSANGWTAFNAAGTNAIPVSSPGLTYAGIPATGIGNCVSLTTNGEDDYNATAYTTQTESLTGTSIYASFMINVSAAQATGDYFFSFYNTSGTASFSGGKVFIKSSGTGFVMAVGKTATAGTYTSTVLNFNQTYFIVVKHTMIGPATGAAAGTDDVSTFWINPGLGLATEPTFDGQDGAGTDPTSALIARTNRVALRQGATLNAPTLRVDGIRVGTTWQSVTTLSVGAITPTAYVPGDAITIPVITYGTYTAGNIFTAFLSDASGSFATETPLSPTLTATNSITPINIITAIPGAAVPGTNYKIRIKSSNPVVVGAESAPLTVLAALVNYYYKGTGNIADVANWSTNTSGTGGTQPFNFTASGQIFNIRNCTTLVTSAPWTVDGAGSKIVLNDNAAAPITLTITSGNDITTPQGAYFDIAGTGNTIVYQSTNALSLSTVVDPLTNITFDGIGCNITSGTAKTYNILNVTNGATATFTGAPIFSSVTVDATSSLGTSNLTSNFITVNGNIIVNGKFKTLKTTGMYNALTGSTGGALQPSGTLTIGAASTIEFARGTASNFGAQTVDARTDYYNLILSNSGVASSKTLAGVVTIAGTLTINTLLSGVNGPATLGGLTTVNGNLTLTSGNIISTTANMLTLDASATVTGGSNTSFVSGPITRNTNATSAYVFPVGKGTVYKPATITPVSASAGMYTSEYFAVGQGSIALTSPLDNISTSEYWDIARISGPDITLSLQYAPTTWANAAPDNTKSIGIAHFVAGTWIKESAVAISGSATSGTLVSTVLSSFSPFTFAAAPTGLLPLSLIEFSANKSTNGIQLTWKINEDNSVAKYEVEKSYDARNFLSFETVQATAQLGEKSYASFDANATAGVIYYRLKMISNTGNIKYSNIIKIETNGKAGISIYPNPITNNSFGIQMYKQPKGDYTIAIYSMDGKVMEQKQLNHNGTDGTRTVALKNNLLKGNYFIVVKNANIKIGTYPVLIQ